MCVTEIIILNGVIATLNPGLLGEAATEYT
jgi:hypothetical protein